MILLTKLDNSKVLLNLEAVKYMEATPDTLILFNNSDKLIVRESLEEIQQSVIKLRAEVLSAVSPESDQKTE